MPNAIFTKGFATSALLILCGVVSESTNHLMRECSYSRGMWLASPLGIPHPAPRSRSFLEVLLKWATKLIQNNFEICLMIMWAIWSARNDHMWNDKMESPNLVMA
ncbi:hypothetical protein C1H46_036289 [Malus baccata]|uniref:Reverse transcriptase zinc-binding domain-containing protein n=1 Tax=Malus baccata TaxID=106549 RepID=A0A540KVA5_MALBA|nr:hypothetical protein C1H46_036289 [Malus baccata]